MTRPFALAKALAAKATVVTATEPWTEAAYATPPIPSMISTYEKSAAGDAANILNNAKQSAENVGIPVETSGISMRPTQSSSWQKSKNAIMSLWDRMDAAALGGSFLAALPLKCSVSAKDPYSSATRLRGCP